MTNITFNANSELSNAKLTVTQLAGALGTETLVLVPEITGWLFHRDKYVWSKYVKPFHKWTPKTVEKALRMWLEKKHDPGLHVVNN